NFDVVFQNRAVAKVRERSNPASSTNLDRAREHREGKNRGIRPNLTATVNVRGSWIDDTHSFGHQSVQNSSLHEGVRLGEVLSRVDPQNVVWFEDWQSNNFTAQRLEQGRGIREVVFALGVAGVELGQSVPKTRQLEHIAAWVNLFD